MSRKILFIAPLGVRNGKEHVFNEVVSLFSDNDYSSLLYLGPNIPFLASTRRQFFSYLKMEHTKRAFIPFQSLTIRQLSLNLIDTHGGMHVISDEIRTLILFELLSEKSLGYARLLSDLLNKIRHYILDKGLVQLKDDISRLMFEEKAMARAIEALTVLHAYEQELEKKELLDSDSALKESLSLVTKIPSPFRVVIDGFFDPTPLEMKFIRQVLSVAQDFFLLVEENTPLAELPQLLAGMEVRKLKPAEKRSERRFTAYASLDDEVEGIARSIRKLLFDGIRPWEIIVSFPVLSKYRAMVRRVFERFSIPVNIIEHDLSSARPVVVIEDLIRCLEDDYTRNDFLSVLTSPLLPAVSPVLQEWAVSLSYKAGIIKGKESWLSMDRILRNETDEMDDDAGMRIDEVQKEITRVVQLLESAREQRDLLSFINAFEAVLGHLGFFDVLDREATGLQEDVILRIGSILTELKHFAEVYGAPAAPFPPWHYLRFLLEGMKGADENIDGVSIAPFSLAASIGTRELFFGGMIEGDFPSRPGIDPILPELVKRELGMPFLEYYLKRQKKYFNRLLHISEHAPRFSCPRADGDKVFLPSPFLDWDEALDPVAWDIYTEEEAQMRQGELAGTDPAASVFWGGDFHFNRQSLAYLNKRYTEYISVTDLDFYRKCPRRFYIEKVLCLELARPPQFEVEARLWGSLAHKTMERLYSKGDVPLNEFEKKLFSALQESLRQFPIDDFWSGVAGQIFLKLLPLLKKAEVEIRRQGYRPFMIEQKITAEINGMKLKGKIDRIDRKDYGTDEKTTAGMALIDYKTGTIDKDSLQLPLYAGMWQENFADPVDRVGFYSLKDGDVAWYPKKTSLHEYINTAIVSAQVLVDKMRRGEFPAEPAAPAECRYCDHSSLCDRSV